VPFSGYKTRLSHLNSPPDYSPVVINPLKQAYKHSSVMERVCPQGEQHILMTLDIILLID